MSDNEAFLLRIKLYLDTKNISIWQLERDSQLTKGVLNNAIRGKSAIGSDKLALIFTHNPEINPTWLLTGKGEMLLALDNKDSQNLNISPLDTHTTSAEIKMAEYVEKAKGLEAIIQKQKEEIVFLREEIAFLREIVKSRILPENK